MYTVENFLMGQWVKGEGDGQLLYNAVTGEPIANATSKGLDFAAALHYARTKGNPALRKMSFHERGLMLRALDI
jgi:oxepin-CoA hydrolase/3-oxo-5,6-dehydrosuberyl-CoA semialdehyde dehydrogenase